jgi:hypothetical protein
MVKDNIKIIYYYLPVYYIIMWYSEFNSTFWLSIAGSVFGLTAIVIKAFKSSKCKEFKCFCISCIRDTQLEEKLDELELQQHNESSKEEHKV